jgi:hypothetical protein
MTFVEKSLDPLKFLGFPAHRSIWERRVMLIEFIAALMMAQAPAAAAPQAPTVQEPAAAAPAKPAEKKICRVDMNDSSSRLRKRVCLSQTEWNQKESGVSANDLKTMGAH